MKPRFLLALITGAGFALRLACINSGLPGKSLSLTTYHPDESITLYSIAAMKPERLDFSPGESFYWGSLYTYVTAAALKAASAAGYVKENGRKFFEANLREADKLYLVGRGVSVLAGTLCVPLMFLAGEALAGTGAGLLAALLMAVSAGPVMASVYLKPDALMLFFCALTVYLSVRILKKKGGRACLWAGLAAGLAAASKYNGAVIGMVPLLAALLARDRKSWQVPAFFAAGFVAGCPYCLIEPASFLKVLKVVMDMGLKTPPPWNLYLHTGLPGYFSYYLRYAFGWPLMAALAFSLAWTAAKCAMAFKKTGLADGLRDDLFLLVPAAAMLALFSASSRQVVLYGLPAWPLFFLLMARAAAELYRAAAGRPAAGKALLAAGCLAGAHGFVYSAAYAGLFYGKNVREEASDWIEANIGKDKKIGVTKKYFWTPPALRKLGPGYDVLSFQDDRFDLPGGVLSLKATAARADYLVLSDFEIKDFLRLPAAYPAEYAVLKDVLGAKFSLEARFEKSPAFFGVTFRKANPPWDWMYPDPTIYVYRKKAPAVSGTGGRAGEGGGG